MAKFDEDKYRELVSSGRYEFPNGLFQGFQNDRYEISDLEKMFSLIKVLATSRKEEREIFDRICSICLFHTWDRSRPKMKDEIYQAILDLERATNILFRYEQFLPLDLSIALFDDKEDGPRFNKKIFEKAKGNFLRTPGTPGNKPKDIPWSEINDLSKKLDGLIKKYKKNKKKKASFPSLSFKDFFSENGDYDYIEGIKIIGAFVYMSVNKIKYESFERTFRKNKTKIKKEVKFNW